MGQDIYFGDTQIENYPLLSSEIILFDGNGEIVIPTLDQLLIYENTVGQNVVGVNCPPQNIRKSKAIIAIDISSSMLGKGEELSKVIARNIISNSDYFSEFALIAFNQHSYLLSDFTSDVSVIENGLNWLDPRGSTNFDSLFFDKSNGIFSLTGTQDDENYSVFMISDGNAAGDFEKIGDSLASLGIPLYSFGLFRNLPNKIVDACKISGGKSGDEIEKDEDAIIYASVFSLFSTNYKACIINWKSYLCLLQRNSNFIWMGVKSKDFSYEISDEQIPYLEFSPSEPIIFENSEQGQSYQKSIAFTPKGGDVLFDEILFECDEFEIIDVGTLLDTLIENQEYNLIIEYSPTDAVADICQFWINSNKCRGFSFFSASSDELIASHLLRVDSPSGGDLLIAGDTHKVIWSGTLPSDLVRVEWSGNGGEDWNLEEENALSNAMDWSVPDVDSDDCKIRISKLSEDNKLNDVSYLSFSEKDILGLQWSGSENIFAGISFISGEYELRLFNWDNLAFQDEGWGNLQGLRTLRWANDLPKLVVHKDFGDENRPIIFEIGGEFPIQLQGSEGAGREVNALAFSPDDKSIVGGLLNGNVLIWENYDDNLLIDFHFDELFNSEILNIEWSVRDFIASGNAQGEISIINLMADTVTKYYFTDTEIKYLRWSQSGDSLFVVTEGDGAFFLKYVEFNGVFSFSQETVYEKDTEISTAFWDEDNSHFFIASDDIIKIIDYGGSVKYEFKGHSNSVERIDYNGDMIISSDGKKDVLIWDPYRYPHEEGIIQSTESGAFTIKIPELRLKEMNLGTFCKGFSIDTTKAFAIENRTGVGIYVDSIKILNDPLSEIIIRDEFPIFLKKDAFATLVFNINPKSEGNKSFQMNAYSYKKIFNTDVNAHFVAPDISLSEGELNFGKVNVSETFSKNIEVVNNGNFEVNILNIEMLFGEEFFSFGGSSSSFTLEGGASEYIDVLFRPTEKRNYSGLIKIHSEENCTPLEIRLNGKGVAPEFSANNLFDLGEIFCDNKADTVISIGNTGDGILYIKEIEYDEDKFEIGEETPITVQAGGVHNLLITFIGQEYESMDEEIIFHTNTIYQSDLSHTINIRLENIYTNFSVSTSQLLFTDIASGESKTLSFEIQNNGDREFQPNKQVFNDFEIVSIIPETIPAGSIPAGSSATITVKFLGGTSGVLYEEIYFIRDKCENVSELKLVASPGVNKPYLSTLSGIEMKNDYCTSQFDSLIVLKNIGSKDLLIDSLVLVNNSGNVFKLRDYNHLDTIKSGQEKSFTLEFSPSNAGEYSSNLLIYSNDEKNSGIHSMGLNAKYFKQYVSFSVSSVDFYDLKENQEYSQNITIFNNGWPAYRLENEYENNDFIIDDIQTNPVPAQGSTSARVTFLGGVAEAEKSATFTIKDTCGILSYLSANAIVRGADFAQISGETFSSAPGRSESFPIYFQNTSGFDYAEDINISTTISFNASLLYPKSEEKGVVIDGRRYLPVSATFNPENNFIIAPQFISTLGDWPSTEIIFEQTIISNYPKIWFESETSTFTIVNSGDGGGQRLISSGENYGISVLHPNPARDIIRFTVFLPDEEFTVRIYDAESRLMQAYSKQESSRQVYFEINVSKYAGSNYFIVVSSENSYFSKSFIIRR